MLQQFVRELADDLQERYVRWRTEWIVRILDGVEREVNALSMERGDRLSVLLVVQTERQRETFRQILQLTETGVLFGVRVRIVVGARSKVQERIAQRFRHRLCAQNLVDLSQFAQGELDNVAVVVEELCGRGAIERLEELSRMIEIRIS